MNQINLIPAPRRKAKARRTRLVRWGIVLGLYVGALLGAHFVCGACWSGDSDQLAAETRASAARLREANRLMLSLHSQMTQTEEKLRSRTGRRTAAGLGRAAGAARPERP